MSELTLDPKKLSKDEMNRALELLQREKVRKEKIATGELKGSSWAELTEEQKASRRLAGRKRNARIALMCKKAEAAGITVTEAEIDAAIKAGVSA